MIKLCDECERLPCEAEYWKMKAVICAENLARLQGELAAANRSLDWCGQQIDGCGVYTKEEETVFQALERNWKDSLAILGELAKERQRAEKAEAECERLRAELAAARKDK